MISEAQNNRLPHVVIIGGGFGGLRAARALRKSNVRLIVIDKNNHHLFQPLLYQVATAALSPGEIAAPIRMVLHDQKNTEVLMAKVVAIDQEKSEVILESNERIHFDYLIIATGATHSYFGHDEWAQFAPGLKSISDATEIRKRILLAFERAELEHDAELRKALLTIVLVGAGPTGVEMAGSIAELSHIVLRKDFQTFDPASARIMLIEAGPKILAAFPDSLSRAAERKLQKLGVEVCTNSTVEAIDSEGVTIKGNRILTSTVIWAAGVRASLAAQWLNVPADRNGRVIVNSNLSLDSDPAIYVIGDTAHCPGGDGKPLPGVAAVAMQQGTYAGNRIAAIIAGKQHSNPFQYFDKGSLATIGRAFAVAAMGKLRLAGFLAWIVWLFVHILYLIGFRNRLIVMIQWAWAYLTFERGVRLIVSED